jgi:hypothetical protein
MMLLAVMLALTTLGCTPVTGPHALAYEGAPSCAVLTTDGAVPQSATVEAWVRGDPAGTGAVRPLFQWEGFLELTEDESGSVRLSIGGADAAQWTFSLMDGVLHHVAATYDAADGSARTWVDGEAVAARSGLAVPESAGVFRVGCSADYTRGWWGLVDEIRVSTIARYAEAFTPEGPWIADGDTTALFHLDEGQGNALASATGAWTGTMSDASWVAFDLAAE